MNHGLRRPRLKHTDYDFHRTFGTVGQAPTFPLEFNTDAGYPVPDQNREGQPDGCTNYSQAALSTDLTKRFHNPFDLEAVTHANQLGGFDIRDSMDAARKLGWFKAYFNVQAYEPLDWYDALRYSQLMGVRNNELRSLSIGTPWFPSWEQALLKGATTVPMPTPEEITAITHNSNAYGWHNWNGKGWNALGLRGESHQGSAVGVNGIIIFPREVINVVMSLKYSVAYTPTLVDIPTPYHISLPLLDWLLSFVRNFPAYLRY